MELRLIQHFGKISYSLYIVHIPLLFSIFMKMFEVLFEKTGRYNFSTAVTYLVSLVLLIAVSTAYYHVVEKNCNKLTEKIMAFFVSHC
jgi:peptidoglycan/LPS O-acetylase OafA/YrhL